jgi:crotonobetainyl-CoA:carnitine CoA-transferase CaiB-like acyl-CoA transferase
MAPHAAVYFATGEIPGPGTLTLNGRYPCYRMYTCADGAVSVGALEPKFWRELVTALGLPHLADSAFADGADGQRVADELQGEFARRTRAELSAMLADRDVCCEPVLRLDEVFEHPQVEHRGMLLAAGAAGPVAQVGSPIRLNRSQARVRRQPPGWGADTRDVLGEAGYDGATLDALVAEGAAR